MQTKFKEDLSIAYLRAICAKDETTFNLLFRDEDGSDVDLNKNIITLNGCKMNSNIRVQLKSTSSKSFYEFTETHIIYKAKKKCYNDLVSNRCTPLYLFLLILPEEEDEFINFTIEQLIIKKCMYWVKLDMGEPKTTEAFVKINIDINNYLSPEILGEIMEKEGNNL